MDSLAVEQAKGRLRRAEKAIQSLKSAANYEDAEDAWSDFLQAVSTIYSKLEQGSKSNGRSAGWFCRKKKERKDDPLLRFLHYARNSDEHGIERVAERGGNQYDLLDRRRLKFNERQEVVFEVTDPITGAVKVPNTKAWLYGPCLEMIRAHDRRFNDYCDPPMQHLGVEITLDDNHLIGKSSLAIAYLTSLVAEAEALV